MTEKNYALEQAKAQYESICACVAALEGDYDRVGEWEEICAPSWSRGGAYGGTVRLIAGSKPAIERRPTWHFK